MGETELSRDAVIGLISPGEMGAAVGAALVDAGHRVLWARDGRSSASAQRAQRAGLTAVDTVAGLVAASDVVLSVCPPRAALETARAFAAIQSASDPGRMPSGAAGRPRWLYVDANAIAPQTAEHVRTIVQDAGAEYVDGGIVGSPPQASGTTRLYLAGASAPAVASLFAGSVLQTVVLEGVTAASALKMTYAAWTKGTTALLLATRAAAESLGVAEALEAEWRMSQPALLDRLPLAHGSAQKKGWRWIAEMEEIAATFEAVGQPGGFHEAAAQVYRRAGQSRPS